MMLPLGMLHDHDVTTLMVLVVLCFHRAQSCCGFHLMPNRKLPRSSRAGNDTCLEMILHLRRCGNRKFPLPNWHGQIYILLTRAKVPKLGGCSLASNATSSRMAGSHQIAQVLLKEAVKHVPPNTLLDLIGVVRVASKARKGLKLRLEPTALQKIAKRMGT